SRVCWRDRCPTPAALAAIPPVIANEILADHDDPVCRSTSLVRIACVALAVLFALGLIVVVARLVFGRDAVVTFSEDLGLIIAIFVLPVVLGLLLIVLAHRGLKGMIEK